VQIKAKSPGILGGLRAFLTKIGADKRLLQAVYHYGAPPDPRLGFLYKFVFIVLFAKKNK